MDKESKRQELIQIFSDAHKDAYGFRPRWKYTDLTLEELESYFRSFEAEFQQKAIESEERVKEFNILLSEVVNMCSCTVQDAVRYLMDAEDCEEDMEYFNYLNGLPYSYVQGLMGEEVCQ